MREESGRDQSLPSVAGSEPIASQHLVAPGRRRRRSIHRGRASRTSSTPSLSPSTTATPELAAGQYAMLTFGPDGEEFWKTERLLHHDLYNGQPCSHEVADDDGSYIDLLP